MKREYQEHERGELPNKPIQGDPENCIHFVGHNFEASWPLLYKIMDIFQ